MAEILNFGEAAQRAGVSRERLNKAIRSGRLPATRGGGPGKPTTIRLEDLQAWCQSEGLAMPVDAAERLERSQLPALTEMMGRLEQMFAGFERLERLVEQVLERLGPPTEHPQHAIEPPTPPPALSPPTKADVLARVRTLRDAGLSLQQIADLFHAEGVPTLSGRGRWQKGTVGKLLTQAKGG